MDYAWQQDNLYIFPKKKSALEDAKIIKFTNDIKLFKQDVGYWRYVFVDIFLKFFIPLANGCTKTFWNIYLVLHTYYAKIVYIQGKPIINRFSTLKEMQAACDKMDQNAKTPRLCTNMRSHVFMKSLPAQTLDISIVPRNMQQNCTLQILSQPPKNQTIRADVIFLHGLHGASFKTWRQGLRAEETKTFMFERLTHRSLCQIKREQRAQSEERQKILKFLTDNENAKEANSSFQENEEIDINENYTQCWPADWLPLDCPGVRVIGLNYATEQYMWRPVWIKPQTCTSMRERANEMLELLIAQRVGVGHPIIWVGHSKGGLYIKQIILDAWESGRPAATPLWHATRGIFFYSVPHRGSTLASIRAPLLARSIELQEVARDNAHILELHRRFLKLYYLGHLKIEVFSFIETGLTLISMLYLRIVDITSGDPGIGDICGIHLDHKDTCKPRNRDCVLYRKLVEMIKKIY